MSTLKSSVAGRTLSSFWLEAVPKIGIRMALGAQRSDILRQVVGEGARRRNTVVRFSAGPVGETFVEMMASAHSRCNYVLPITHLCAWLVSMSGHLLPKLDFLGILSTFLIFADFPISLAALALTWKHPDLAAMWILIVGTMWWYLLSCVTELAIRRFKARRRGGLDKLSY